MKKITWADVYWKSEFDRYTLLGKLTVYPIVMLLAWTLLLIFMVFVPFVALLEGLRQNANPNLKTMVKTTWAKIKGLFYK